MDNTNALTADGGRLSLANWSGYERKCEKRPRERERVTDRRLSIKVIFTANYEHIHVRFHKRNAFIRNCTHCYNGFLKILSVLLCIMTC